MGDRAVHVVTGGLGFIGSNLCAALAKGDSGASVIVIDDGRTGSFANLVEAHERLGLGPFGGRVLPRCVGEIDWASLLEDLRPTAVFHLGAITDTTVRDEALMLRVNTGASGAILRASIDHGVRLVYASSAATYGTPPQAARREPFPIDAAGRPSNVYGFSKWLVECDHRRLAERAVACGGAEPWVVGLRYFNVFGPGESRKGKMASMVHQLAGQVLAGERPRLFRDGSQARDQVHVDDVVACTMAAAGLGGRAKPRPGIYNLGSGVATSFNAVADAIRGALGLSRERGATEYFDMPPGVRAFYQAYTCADMGPTRDGLGWSPGVAPEQGIREYALHLRRARG